MREIKKQEVIDAMKRMFTEGDFSWDSKWTAASNVPMFHRLLTQLGIAHDYKQTEIGPRNCDYKIKYKGETLIGGYFEYDPMYDTKSWGTHDCRGNNIHIYGWIDNNTTEAKLEQESAQWHAMLNKAIKAYNLKHEGKGE